MKGLKTLRFNSFEANCIVMWNEKGECLVVDPGCNGSKEEAMLDEFIAQEGLRPIKILLTHGHMDHVLGVPHLIDRYGIKAYLHPADRQTLKSHMEYVSRLFGRPGEICAFETEDLGEGEHVGIEGIDAKVIETPGHTPGGVCFLLEDEKLLLSGDTLFAGTIGRTDLEGGDYDRLMDSIFTKLVNLDGTIDVIPGHGPVTTIADENQKNPFLQPFNEAPMEEE